MSQSSYLESVGQWTPEECQQHSDTALPKLLHYLNETECLEQEIEIVCMICQAFLPVVPHEYAEEKVFSKISHKTTQCFDASLGKLQEVVQESQAKLDTVHDQLASLLQLSLSIVGCLENCVGYLSQCSEIQMTWMHSLHPAVLHTVHAAFLHCKDSSNIYGNFMSAVADQLSTLFKRAHNLQMGLMGIVDKVVVSSVDTEQDVLDLAAIIHRLYDLTHVASALDVKIMITVWKSISRLCCQHKANVGSHLELPAMLKSLTSDMISSYDYLIQMIPSTQRSEGDDKTFGKNVKVLGFQMKVLMMLVREYDDFLGDAVPNLYRLLLTVHKNVPPSLKSADIPSKFVNEIQRQITMATEPLTSYLIPNRTFFQCSTSSQQDLEKELFLPRCLMLITVLDSLHNYPDEIQEQWLLPTLHPEDEPVEDLVSAVFSAIARCTTELCVPVYLPGVMCHGKPQREVSLYEHICTRLCAFVASFPAQHFTVLETSLLNAVSSQDTFCAFIAIDVWCFMARYGTADLCRDHCFLLANLVSQLMARSTPQCCHLVVLFRRLLRFMAPEHQSDFVKQFGMSDNISLWSVVPIDIFSPALAQQVTDELIPVCAKVIHNWNNSSSPTPLRALTMIESLHCLQNVFKYDSIIECHITEQTQELIQDKCCHLLDNLAECSECVMSHVILQQVMASLLNLLVCLVGRLDTKHIYKVLSLSSRVISASNCRDSVKLSTLSFIRELGKKSLPPSFEQGQILRELPRLFASLLDESNPVIHGQTLQVFAQFAEETVHESVVPDSLHNNAKLQENVVKYLNQVATGSVPECKFDYIEQEAADLEDMSRSGISDMYPPALWPSIQQQHTCNQPAKKIKYEGNDPSMEQSYREVLDHLQQGVQQLQWLRQQAPLPPWLVSEVQTLYGQMGSML